MRPRTVGQFFVSFEKKATLMPLHHILHVFKTIGKKTRFLTFESQLRRLNCSVLRQKNQSQDKMKHSIYETF